MIKFLLKGYGLVLLLFFVPVLWLSGKQAARASESPVTDSCLHSRKVVWRVIFQAIPENADMMINTVLETDDPLTIPAVGDYVALQSIDMRGEWYVYKRVWQEFYSDDHCQIERVWRILLRRNPPWNIKFGDAARE